MILFITQHWQTCGAWLCCLIIIGVIAWRAGTEIKMEDIEIEFDDYKD